MRPSTRLIQSVFGATTQGQPMLPSPVFVGTYHHAGDPGDMTATYGRTSNPTWTAYETVLAELEGGPCLVFASGMAASAAVLCSTLRPGDIVVMPSDGYYGARALAADYLAQLGVEIRHVPTASNEHGAALVGARLMLLESPCNPALDVCNIAALADLAHAAGALVAIDNSTATAYGQQPLLLGVDYSVNSDTKALTGHSDLLLGHVAVRDPALLPPLASWRSEVGAIAGPMETWLAHRSLATLAVRLDRQCRTALLVAEALRDHPAVAACRYPGLPSDPSYRQAAAQMTHFGPVINFTLEDAAQAERWLAAVRLITPATSFGSVHSTAERRARWGADDVPPGFIRLSIGLEDPDDLIADIAQALA